MTNEKEIKAMNKALEYAGTLETIEEAISNDSLTINKGRDGKRYAWYCTEGSNVAVEVETLNIITDEEEIENLFC